MRVIVTTAAGKPVSEDRTIRLRTLWDRIEFEMPAKNPAPELLVEIRRCDCGCDFVFIPRQGQRFFSATHRSFWHRKIRPL